MTENTIPKALSKYELLLLIPETINTEELIKAANLYSTEIDPKKLLSLLSLITTELTSYNYEKELHVTHKKINIHSNKLKKCCSNNYKLYFNFLYESDVLTTRSPFNAQIKGQSFGYGFTNSHAFRRLQIIVLDNSKPINYDKKFKSYVEKYEKILYKLFDRTKFSIDFNIAEKNLFNKYLDTITFPLDSKDKSKWRRYSAYHGALKQLVMFLNGKHTFIRKTKQSERKPSGRFYSSLTFLNKITRSLLYYEGKKLQQLDVRNMFPYLLSQHLKETAILDSHRVKRLQSCPVFKAKYKLNNAPYLSKKFVSSQWLEQYLIERYGTLLLPKSMSVATNGSLVQQDVNKNFFLDIPKNLFQDSDSHFQHSNKKFYSPFLNYSKRGNWNQSPSKTTQGAWKSRSEQETQKGTYPNSQSQAKGMNDNSHLATLYTENYNSSNVSERFNLAPMEYSNYISKKILETLMDKEISKFNTLSTEGVIYDHFIELFKVKFTLIEWGIHYQSLFNDEYNYLYEQDRELAKKLFISMLYAPNNRYIKEQEVFKSEFPILYDLIREKKKGNHKVISHELFDLEAELIVDTIARGLIKKKIPTFTIHDCIAVQEQNIEISELKMKDAFISRFGSCPKIKLE
ncbi:hypothetical protein A0O34_11960 [Chryseobacterium glaciei]|uniref:Uncharacterized protein n=1 Tax=Chryseobacterium glaciei TaxID=1685010 RepID=A0A172XW28_9FLAO|nr:hypothetical protein [Chryseobacterium glaciei]ANF51188.1 hypothetical protein A0O34_11960 [Chryseobacterium glaciei]